MKRTPISGLEVFLSIARHGSLRSAAQAMGLGSPAVSQQLKAFERQIGVDLFTRTTRSVELTEAGSALLSRAGPAFSDIRDAIEEARGVGQAKIGNLRLTLPWSAYKIVFEPVLGEFRAAYPEIQLEFSFDEALVDVVQNGFHAGVRLGNRLTPGMIASQLTSGLREAYSAAPSYLSTHGRPTHPQDLIAHQCIRYRFVSAQRIADWNFHESGDDFTVDPPAGLVFDGFQAVVQAARAGHGIGWSLRAVIERELVDGALETVLEAFTKEQPPFFLYYPEQNRRLELLRVLVEFLKQHRGQAAVR